MTFRWAVPAAILVALASVAPTAARAATPCSVDVFPIEGIALKVQLCDSGPVADAAAAPLPLRKARPATGTTSLVETFSVRGRPPLVRTVAYDRLANEVTARTIDDVPLQSLGISKTLHLTAAIRDGGARLEHALLIPGAIDLR